MGNYRRPGLGMRTILILTTIVGVVAPRMSLTCARKVTMRLRPAWLLTSELEEAGERR